MRAALFLFLVACGQDIKITASSKCNGLLEEGEESVDSPFDLDGDGYFDGNNADCVEAYVAVDCDGNVTAVWYQSSAGALRASTLKRSDQAWSAPATLAAGKGIPANASRASSTTSPPSTLSTRPPQSTPHRHRCDLPTQAVASGLFWLQRRITGYGRVV